jgi:dCMP deaminase
MSRKSSRSVNASEKQCDPPCQRIRRTFKWSDFDAALAPFADPDEAEPVKHWDDYFSAIALTASLRSKDPRRRVGAVVASADRVLLSTGYNWLPRGVKELPERFSDKFEKLKWITHAETNAIFNASRIGISLVGGTIYATTFPCVACAQAIVQAGIVRVFCSGGFWKTDPAGYHLALEIFADAGIAFDIPLERDRDAGYRRDAHHKSSDGHISVRLPGDPLVANDRAISSNAASRSRVVRDVKAAGSSFRRLKRGRRVGGRGPAKNRVADSDARQNERTRRSR